MTKSVFLAEHIATGVNTDGAAQIVSDAALVTESGKILDVGSSERILQALEGAVIDRRYANHTIVPGLVNSHHHIGVTPLQWGMPDLPLEQWVIRRIAEPQIDPYVDALYGALDMVASGITCVVHLHANKLASPETLLSEGLATIRAYRDVGMRVSFAIMFFDQNALGYVGNRVADVLDASELAAAGGIASQAANMDFDEHLGVLNALAGEFAADNGVRIQLAPANLHWCSEASLERFAEVAATSAMPLHMHLLETGIQRRYADWRSGGHGAIEHLRKLGFRGEAVTLGHGTWIRAEEAPAIAEAGYTICHNCSSNLRLSSGIAPVGALVRAGVNVGLGIDEAGLNDDRDMLQEMRLALHLSKAADLAHQPYGLGVGRVLGMATSGGAAAIGQAERLGKLLPGSEADFFVFDHRAAAAPGRSDQWSPLDILLHRGRPRHLRAVHVAGEAIVVDGNSTRVDVAAAMARVVEVVATADYPDESRLAALRRIEERVAAAHREADRDDSWFSR